MSNPRLLLSASAFVGVWAIASLTWPLAWDQGILVWIGSTISRGGMPYRDAWDICGPLPAYLHALTYRVFGAQAWGLRIVDLACLFATAALVRAAVRRLASTPLGNWAAILFILWYASGSFWHTAQRDGWGGMLLVAAIAPLVARADPARSRIVAAGLWIGAAALVKPFFAVFLIVPSLRVWLSSTSRRDKLTRTIEVTIAAAVPPVLCMLWFAAHGTLGDFIEAYVRYPLDVYAPTGLVGRLLGAADYALTGKVIVVALPLSLGGLWILFRDARADAWCLGSWAVLAAAAAVAQGRFFEYHWVPMFAPLVMLAAVMVQAMTVDAEAARSDTQQRFAAVYLLVLLVHAAVHPAFDVADAAARTVVGRGLDASNHVRSDLANVDRMAAYVRSHTEPADRIAVWGWHAYLYVGSGRQSASRFGFSMPLVMSGGSPLRQRYRLEFLDAVRTTKPVYVIVGPMTTAFLGSERDLQSFPEFWTLMQQCYELETAIGALTAYRIRGCRV